MPAKKNYGAALHSQRAARRDADGAAPLGLIRAIPMRMAASDSTLMETARTASSTPPLPMPLRDHAERALSDYFASLDGHRPAHLYDLVIREVEEPLFRAVLDHCDGNQSRAAGILGINRGTLRKKLREFGLSA